MAEYVLAHVLQIERGLLQLHAQQKAKEWCEAPFREPRCLTSLTLGVLGPGDIGRVVGRRAQGIGLRTVALKRDGLAVPHFDEVLSELPALLGQCDYVVSLLPSTPATRGLLSGGALRNCRKGAVLINAGRGDVVDEESILLALAEGWLSHAVLDVFASEPLAPTSPLWTHPQVSITPHISAPSTPQDVADVFIQNLERYATGQDLLHVLDWKRGY
ncbi:unnamed protein product [Polarella glacialis]|uniref:D-isomer specific 2-hydroxyacid dehydrogenase NAD-binding domain-containing protein n=1 Tax=Polarella glacialis TaxID=89957 RepID=A0A813FVH7_POLGL|nr:unnamed protein product [Polarella glacialis]